MKTPLPVRPAAVTLCPMVSRFCAWSLVLVLAPLDLVAQSVPATRPAATEEAPPPVTLSPFEVTADATDTYEATNTNSVTGTNTSLLKTPLDARIFNRTMMDELGVTDVSVMLSDLGGMGLPLFGGGGSGSDAQRGFQEGDLMQYQAMSSRGMTISNPRRDGFLRSETSMFDSFDVETAEALQGSNSLLFGSGDAGGVVNINSKRARLGKITGRFAGTWDTEGSERYTTDLNAGTKSFAVRVNGLKDSEKVYRPHLRTKQEGLQLAATIRPVKWLSVNGDYRHMMRDQTYGSGITVRAPTTLRLSTGELLDNQSSRYITGVGGSALIGDFITLANQDSVYGEAGFRAHYVNISKSVTVEVTPHPDLAFQFRYGHDNRVNTPMTPGGSVYHPDSPLNLYRDANGNPMHQWAINSTMAMGTTSVGARGYKFTAAGHRDLGRWGDHRLNVFFSDQQSWNQSVPFALYELDASGNVIQNLANLSNTDSGRTVMPAVWGPAFPTNLIGGGQWPVYSVVSPATGKSYRMLSKIYQGARTPTAANPLGLSGPIDPLTGRSTSSYTLDDTHERSTGFATFSSFWGGRIDTMAGFRFESADTVRITTTEAKGPVNYNSTTLGFVVDTPIKGVRVFANYATNAKINFTTDRDIFNQTLPNGKGVSRDAGFKFSLWDHGLSGNVNYYITEAKNFGASLGATRDDVDPDGINGRFGGASYLYSKKSDGLSVALTGRPRPWWEITLSFTQANGAERSNVELPIFYNDEFNTTTVGGQQVVAVKSGTGTLTPLMVPSNPQVPAVGLTPLSLAMLKDPSSPYFAVLDPDSGHIINMQELGLLTAGVGTGRNGLAISNHQLGFVPPSKTIIVRRAGERTTGYAENAFSVVNRFQVREGRLAGLVFGLSTIYQRGLRGYQYTDLADAGKRKTFYYPDRFQNNLFTVYNFKLPNRYRASVQVNVANLFDKQDIVALPNSTTGKTRYFAYQYSPRKISFTTTLSF
jgi:outer membrane receptor protein involved in Fe transport